MGFGRWFRKKFFGKQARREWALAILGEKVYPKIRAKFPEQAGEIISAIEEAIRDS